MRGQEQQANSRLNPSTINAALAAMNAEELRDFVQDMLPWFDDQTHDHVVSKLIERASRSSSGWTPDGPKSEKVAAIIAFAEKAKRRGYADPTEVDDHLREGCDALSNRDYAAAVEIFHALLVPITECEIDLGQHELVEEVLSVDVALCAARYVVSIYMTTAPEQRARAVQVAIDEMEGAGHWWSPLQEIEDAAVEPLPEFEDFLPRWQALLKAAVGNAGTGGWDTRDDSWLREAVQRLEGAAGLAELALSTKSPEDLLAWCDTLVQARDWKAALGAFAEAAEIVTGNTLWRGDFLDGAALAAQELGRKDLPARVERAWRGSPSMLRLCRWLGSAKSKAVARKRAAQALEACSKKAHRQRALLHVILGDFEAAAKLLATAPGLGWSDSEHPGHLLFPLFSEFLGVDFADIPPGPGPGPGPDFAADGTGPRLATPEVEEILRVAGLSRAPSDLAREAMCAAMRKAASKRVAAVTENKRRRHYGHAASLVAACAAADRMPAGARWLTRMRADYARYPALRRELDGRLESM